MNFMKNTAGDRDSGKAGMQKKILAENYLEGKEDSNFCTNTQFRLL